MFSSEVPMLPFQPRWLLPAVWLAAATAAQAGPVPPTTSTSTPSPLDATVPVPLLAHESAFAGYRGLADTEATRSWRETNEHVGRIGGWRVYAREAQQPDSAPTAAPSAPFGQPTKPMPSPTPQGHGSHPTP
jgi:hypothetical protein